jgi:predicted Ser/Thr protein kinase
MSREDRLAELLERWEQATTTHVAPTPESLCQDSPELLTDFRDLLAKLKRLDLAMNASESPAGFEEEIQAGRYRARRLHAQGGLGMVFLADDGELRREVALKTMKPLLATDTLARLAFEREAEITGRLEHPGVVPIYGLGRDDRGRPFYAMRFIQGKTLGEAIDEHHREAADDSVRFQRLIRQFIAVCETMAFAHSRGVIHRDLKPGNIMLGEYGETLVVDWGLAKRVGAAGEETRSLPSESLPLETMMGQVKGSPSYMSPEQARGDTDQIGVASDIYSLGTTLYVLLTARPPFPGKNAREVIERVRDGSFRSPRDVRPQTPRPLDAICRKAMSREPAARYAGAGAMASDLERWLADEPVTAWSEPFLWRARRWTRRHRSLVLASAVGLLVALVGLAIASARLEQKNRELDLRNVELVAANTKESEARQRAERLLEKQLATLDGLTRFAVLTRPARAARNDPDQRVLLEHLATRLDDAREEAPENPKLRRMAGLAHFLLASCDPMTGSTDATTRHLDAADRLFDDPADAFHRWGRAAASLERGRRLAEEGRHGAAAFALERAANEAFAVGDAADQVAENRAIAHATAVSALIELPIEARGFDRLEALARLDRALALMQAAGKSSVSASLAHIMAGASLNRDGAVADPLGRILAETTLLLRKSRILAVDAATRRDAIVALTAALRLIETAPRETARDPLMIEQAARCRFERAGSHQRDQRWADAWRDLDEARRLLSPVAQNVDDRDLLSQIQQELIDVAAPYLETLDASDQAQADLVTRRTREAIDDATRAENAKALGQKDLAKLLRWSELKSRWEKTKPVP